MSKNFDMIAKVNIDIASPVVSDANFDNLLIVGPLPANAPTVAPAKVGAYSSVEEVTAAGWTDADPVGAAALVAFSQKPMPATIYIAPIQDDEDAVDAVNRAVATPGWYVVCTAGVDAGEYADIATAVEAQEKMFCYTETALAGTTVAATFNRSMGIYGGVGASGQAPAENAYMNVAWAAKWLKYESGTETAAFKDLAVVTPAELTGTEMQTLDTACVSYLLHIGGKNVVLGGKVRSGEWADIIRLIDTIKADMQTRVVGLFTSTPKVPYTDKGIALVQNHVIASLKHFQNIGGIAEDEYDADGNVTPGYKTSVPRSANISAADKKSRKLFNVKFSARLAGAIHFADINGTVGYNL